jgi:tetratricopeptide (TPR) repeat protein
MRSALALVVIAGLSACPAGRCAPQQGSTPRQKQTQPQGSKASDASPPPAKGENPFPEDVSRKAQQDAHGAGQGKDALDASPGNAQSPGASGSSAAQDNPFPEGVSRQAADAAGHSAPSTQAPSGVSSSADRDPSVSGDGDAEGGRRMLPKPDRNAIAPGSLTGIGRAKDDVRVGSFYASTGDWRGAYGRFQEASQDDPTNLDAIYGMAEAARHLGRVQEAAENYKIYLEIAPDGPKAKASQKALAELRTGK